MRVIIVTQTFPPRFGGMQSVMSALAKNFSKTITTLLFVFGKELRDFQLSQIMMSSFFKIFFNLIFFINGLRNFGNLEKLNLIL